jgi:hypothetical protein
MKSLQLLAGGFVAMAPALSAPNAYLARVGPKPLSFGAPPRPLEEVVARLPPLFTDLPPKPRSTSDPDSTDGTADTSSLWPMPSNPISVGAGTEFPRLPDDWLDSLTAGGVGPEFSGDSSQGPTPTETAREPAALNPEMLLRFFTTPTPNQGRAVAIPLPFIPAVPPAPTSNSSRAVFRQD